MKLQNYSGMSKRRHFVKYSFGTQTLQDGCLASGCLPLAHRLQEAGLSVAVAGQPGLVAILLCTLC